MNDEIKRIVERRNFLLIDCDQKFIFGKKPNTLVQVLLWSKDQQAEYEALGIRLEELLSMNNTKLTGSVRSSGWL